MTEVVDNYVQKYNKNAVKKWNNYKKNRDMSIATWAASNGYIDILDLLLLCNYYVSVNLSIIISGQDNLSYEIKIQMLKLLKHYNILISYEAVINWAIILNDVELLKYGLENDTENVVLTSPYVKTIRNMYSNNCTKYMNENYVN